MDGGTRWTGRLNRVASRTLVRLGYSPAMVRDTRREVLWWIRARRRAVTTSRPLLRGRAVVMTEPGRVELLPVETLSAGPGEVTLLVEVSAVSPGTERARHLSLPNTGSRPSRPGGSVAGRVVAVGPGVDEVRVGDLVAAFGVTHCSVETVPAASVVRVPDGVPAEDASLILLGIICGQGVHKAGIAAGEPVCVIGAGLIGLLAQRIASAEGSGRVTVVATSTAKAAAVAAGGAEFVLADDLGTIDAPVVIEATGDPSALSLAVGAAAPGGRIVLLGSNRGITADVPVDVIRDRGLELIGAHVLTLDATDAGWRHEAGVFLDHLAAGRVTVRDLADVVVDPREAAAFYRRLVRDRTLVGARFDWTVLAHDERTARASLFRRPDVVARGLVYERAPLAATAARRDGVHPRATRPLRVALLGCGDVAFVNGAALVAAPNAELVAAFDPQPALAARLVERFGGRVAASAASVFDADDVDAVFLAVPHHLHAPLAVEAAGAGKHVIVEKPLANDLRAAGEIVAAAGAAGVTLSICFPHRYEPQIAAARDLVAEGVIGSFAGARLHFFRDKPDSYWVGGSSGRSITTWRSSRQQAGGGVLIMNLCHYLDLLRHVTGVEVDTVNAALTSVDQPSEVEDTVSLTVTYENGAVASLFGSSALRGNREENVGLHLWGPDGQLVLEPDPRMYTVRQLPEGYRTMRWHALPRADRDAAGTRMQYITRLAESIARGERPDVTGEDGLAIQAFIEAAYQSAESGAPVRPAELLKALSQ